MTIMVNWSREYEVNFAYGPTADGSCVIQLIEDARLLSEIAAEFEGAVLIQRASETEGDAEYQGYTVLRAIERDGQAVTLYLRQPEGTT